MGVKKLFALAQKVPIKLASLGEITYVRAYAMDPHTQVDIPKKGMKNRNL
jgi:hypothetical protein